MRVKAITRGYYGEKLRDEGVEFELRDPSHFSHIWMESLDDDDEEVVVRKPKAKAKPKTGGTAANFAS